MEIFGVVNASPDSKAEFSVVRTCAEAVSRGSELIDAGADYFDLGGEGSTLGSEEVSAQDEWQRVSGPLRGLLSLGTEVAIDTRKPEVARRALDAGATVLNAGDALQSPEMVELAAERGVTVVLPFMLGRDFRSVRDVGGDPAAVMSDWFGHHIERLRRSGVGQRLLLDCGVGFGPHDMTWPQRAAYQRAIYGGLDQLRRFNLPLYVPVPWLQTPDRLELLDLALAQNPDYVRAHHPAQVRQRHAALNSAPSL
ncbi:dihydropteroate synthase [Candidatus Poriferisodalis sp.]|uniref:dihydropteroate synthase n=1 Tax=Candidatus Poriferisodalis sp. TaxID=3101277 RepID=UPI003B0172E4